MNFEKEAVYGKNPKHAIMCDSPILCTLDAAYGENAGAIWLVPQLSDLCIYCGVRDKLSKEQIEQLAVMIRMEFGFLKASEVLLFLWRFKSGQYGRFYGSVDPLIIMSALRGSFMNERAKIIDDAEKEQERQWRENLFNDPNRGPRKYD